MAEINVVIPGEGDPGYLRRMMKLAEIQDAIFDDKRDRGDISGSTLRLLVEFIAQFVQVDEGEDPIELLMDLSQNDYMEIMDAIGSVSVPKANSVASEGSTQEG